MKETTIIAIAALTLLCACTSKPDYCSLTALNHPRLFANDKEFAKLKKEISSGKNLVLQRAHEDAMKFSVDHGLSPEPIIYKKDASNKRILSVSREAITRIVSAAYAYRFTEKTTYLEHAEWDINTVCDFKDWNPTHYLDCAEMATAVAIGYDWLYNELQDSTKAKVLRTLHTHAFETAGSEESATYCEWKTTASNWNQVCNTGLTIAALATYEDHPEWAKAFIEECIESNRKAMEGIYPPVGAYSEGPVYWCYGNMFQTLMLAALETTVGTDYDLSKVEGFSGTGLFEAFLDGNTDQLFNYGDNLPKRIPLYPLWYLAWRFDKPELLFREQSVVFKGPYVNIEVERFLPIFIIYMSKINPEAITPPSEKSMFAKGQSDVAIVKTGWEDHDKYLGIKGGSPGTSHSHMDGGSFIYESDGIRWAADIPRQEYQELENPCKEMGGSLWDFSQNSVRWKCFRYSTGQHSTLMVNGKEQEVCGSAVLTERFDDNSFKGASFDLSSLYSNSLKSVKRTAGIVKGEYLEVKDSVCALEDASAHIRWTLVTQSKPEITTDGIILRADGIESLLKVEGADISYKIYPSDPYLLNRNTFEKPVKECICGYEYDLPAGCTKEVTVTLKRIN